jgi:hypothetical protein
LGASSADASFGTAGRSTRPKPSTAIRPNDDNDFGFAALMIMTSLRLRSVAPTAPDAASGAAPPAGRSEMKSTVSSSAVAYARSCPGSASTTHASQHCSSAARSSRRLTHTSGCHQ